MGNVQLGAWLQLVNCVKSFGPALEWNNVVTLTLFAHI